MIKQKVLNNFYKSILDNGDVQRFILHDLCSEKEIVRKSIAIG